MTGASSGIGLEIAKLSFIVPARRHQVGQARKDDPADVAKAGWEAMKSGDPVVICGLKNMMQVAASGLLTDTETARLHRARAEPGSGSD